MQPELYHQNYQSFYPSELITLDHFNMRHPVHREKERTKKLLKFLRDFQGTRDKKKEFATNNVQHKVVYTKLRTRA